MFQRQFWQLKKWIKSREKVIYKVNIKSLIDIFGRFVKGSQTQASQINVGFRYILPNLHYIILITLTVKIKAKNKSYLD